MRARRWVGLEEGGGEEGGDDDDDDADDDDGDEAEAEAEAGARCRTVPWTPSRSGAANAARPTRATACQGPGHEGREGSGAAAVWAPGSKESIGTLY